ncbi:MAG: class I SAM-dependent methyltransferase [Ignavibacteria bacterium]|nr:class I SAM-dependent methyltransferase [Ignavibacteria bacterium]
MASVKPDYLSPEFNFSTKLNAGMLDELPLWSAPFGLKLLDLVDYSKPVKALDIGFGSGFPLLELAQRLGKKSFVYGVDPWKPSHLRTKQKIDFYNIGNIELLNCAAEKIPLKNGIIDLVVSNNGINNVRDVDAVLSELNRVCRKNACFIASLNTGGTMAEFYSKLILVLNENEMLREISMVKEHIKFKRIPLLNLKRLFLSNGFGIKYIYRSRFRLKFSDAESFFSHSLIKVGFLESWKNLIPSGKRKLIFKRIKYLLDNDANKNGYLEMTIPYVVLKSYKI